jgi:hypothetical protein
LNVLRKTRQKINIVRIVRLRMRLKCRQSKPRPTSVVLERREMKNQANYSLYECPYSHIEKECGHELHGPEGYENSYGIWCACGFRGPVFCLKSDELRLKLKESNDER